MSFTRTGLDRARGHPDLGGGIGLGVLLVLLAYATTGGASTANTWAEIALLLVGAGACAELLVLGVGGLGQGTVPALLFGLVAAVTALSILWSVQPDNSWQAANLTLAYLAAFLTAIVAARIAPGRWSAVVSGIGLALIALSAYGLLAKIFPGSLAAADTQGRLQVPLGYWNATGSVAAMGLPACLWAWQRREAGPAARALAVPAAALLMTVTVLSYSRTSLIVVLAVAAGWLLLVPGRLRAVALLAMAGAGTAVMAGWALARPALTGDNAALTDRTAAGHTFGVVCLLALLLLGTGAWAVAVAGARRPLPPSKRRRLERTLLVALALLPVLIVVVLAASSRGLTGEISYAFDSLTNTSPGVSNGANRVTQLGSSRPLYWSEGIQVGEHALLKGVGALGYATARTRYTTQPQVTEHAHSYIIQTFADLGLIGLVINLALFMAWGRAAVAAIATGALRPPGGPELEPERAAERTGLVALVLVVVAFGLSSAGDWTYFFPGVAVPALLAGGWLAGRGRPGDRARRPTRRAPLSRRPVTGALVTGIAALALAGGWLIWQPLRSAQASSAAVAAAIRGDGTSALANARTARAADPLALQPLLLLSAFARDTGDLAGARRYLLTAADLQPENARSWLALGRFDLTQGDPRRALPSLRRAYALDPTVPVTGDTLALAQAALIAGRKPGAGVAATAVRPRSGR